MVLFVLSGMSKYTAYSSGGANADVFNKIPKAMKVLLGMGSFDVSVMSGFFAFLFTYIVVTVAIHAALLGSQIISKEERDKTTEFLITRPVSRVTIITSKLLAALANIVIVNLVTLVSSIGMVSAFNKGKDITGEIIMFYLSLMIIQLIFLTLGSFLAAFMKKPKASGAIATGILLAGYTISKVTDLTDKLDALNILSPFKYFSYERIVDGNGLSILPVVLSLLLAGILTVFTYFFYLKRDLNI
jgi:ABC-2 type transport system permease protein